MAKPIKREDVKTDLVNTGWLLVMVAALVAYVGIDYLDIPVVVPVFESTIGKFPILLGLIAIGVAWRTYTKDFKSATSEEDRFVHGLRTAGWVGVAVVAVVFMFV